MEQGELISNCLSLRRQLPLDYANQISIRTVSMTTRKHLQLATANISKSLTHHRINIQVTLAPLTCRSRERLERTGSPIAPAHSNNPLPFAVRTVPASWLTDRPSCRESKMTAKN